MKPRPSTPAPAACTFEAAPFPDAEAEAEPAGDPDPGAPEAAGLPVVVTPGGSDPMTTVVFDPTLTRIDPLGPAGTFMRPDERLAGMVTIDAGAEPDTIDVSVDPGADEAGVGTSGVMFWLETAGVCFTLVIVIEMNRDTYS